MKIIKKNKGILLYTLFILFFTAACKKEIEYEALSGQLIGYVKLFDSERQDMSDYSGVEVVVEGSVPQIKTTTDESGQYTIDNLKSGVYNLIFNKEGYCQYKIISYQFVGGNKPAYISELPLYGKTYNEVNNLEITDTESSFSVLFWVTADISKSNENSSSARCRYYLSKEPDVSYNNYYSTEIAAGNSNSEGLSFYLDIDTLEFPIGSELYMIVYPSTESSLSYVDINTGNIIYATVNIDKPSNIASITIPEPGPF